MQRDAIEEASYLMNLAIKELADTQFEVLLCCRISIFNFESMYFCLPVITSFSVVFKKKINFFIPLKTLKKRSQKLLMIGPIFFSVLPTGPKPAQISNIFHRNLPPCDFSIMTLLACI